MQVTIKENRCVSKSKFAGTQYENNSTVLEFTYPEKYKDYNKLIAFVLEDGTTLSDALTGNTYTLKRSITKYKRVRCYVCFYDTDNDIDFRSREFVLRFYDNDDIDDSITDEETSIIQTLITTINTKIEEVTALEESIEQAEAEREEATATAIASIQDLTEAYNANAEEKIEEFNSNATEKETEINDNVDAILASKEGKHTYYTYKVEKNISSGTEITLPCSYTVGVNNLVVKDFLGHQLIKDEDYSEVGDDNEESTTIILLSDVVYSERYKKVFDIIIEEV